MQKTQKYVPVALLSTPLPVATLCKQQGYDVGGKSKEGGAEKHEKAPFLNRGSLAARRCAVGNSFQPQQACQDLGTIHLYNCIKKK